MGAGSAGRCRTLWSFQTRANPRAARPYRLQHTRGHCHSSAIVHAPVTHGPAVARSVPTWELSTPTPASRPSAHSTAPTAAGARESHDRAGRPVHRHRGHRPAAAQRASPPRGGGRSRRSATRIPGATYPLGMVSACAYSGAYPTGYGRYDLSTEGVPDDAPRRRPWHPDSRTSSSRAPARSASTTTTSASRRCSSRSTTSAATGASSTRRRSRATTPRRSTPASAPSSPSGRRARCTGTRSRATATRGIVIDFSLGGLAIPHGETIPLRAHLESIGPGIAQGEIVVEGAPLARPHRVRRQGRGARCSGTTVGSCPAAPGSSSTTSARRRCGRSA